MYSWKRFKAREELTDFLNSDGGKAIIYVQPSVDGGFHVLIHEESTSTSIKAEITDGKKKKTTHKKSRKKNH